MNSLISIFQSLFSIIFLLIQFSLIYFLYKKVAQKINNKMLKYLLCFILSEFLLFIISYGLFIVSGGHIYARLSLIQFIFGLWNRSLFFIIEPEVIF
jgi:hypothetical protein